MGTMEQRHRRTGLYGRISPNNGSGEQTSRQIADARELAERRGWEIVDEYVDDSISAYRAKRRPEWDRMMADLAVGRIDAFIAWHPDRTYRRLADLEGLIDLVETTGAEIATVLTGDIDLTSATGRMTARIIAAVNRHESERIGERVCRVKLERARQGRPPGGGPRPFGFEADRMTHQPAEAAALRSAAQEITAGRRSYVQVVDALNAAGMRTTTGREWAVGTLRRVLTSYRMAGIRTYKGKVIGDAAWDPILERDTWEQLRADAARRARGGRPMTVPYLLRGLLRCGRCGKPLYGARTKAGHVYRCVTSPTTSGRGCGGVSIVGPELDQHVLDTVLGWLDEGFVVDVGENLRPGGDDRRALRDELGEIDRRMVVLSQRWAAGDLGDEEEAAARAILSDRRSRVESQLDTLPIGRARTDILEVQAAIVEGQVDEQRAAIAALVDAPLVIEPAPPRHVTVGERAKVRPSPEVWAA